MTTVTAETEAERTARVSRGYHQIDGLRAHALDVIALVRIMHTEFDSFHNRFWAEPKDGADYKALREQVERMDVLQRIIAQRLEALWQGFQAIE